MMEGTLSPKHVENKNKKELDSLVQHISMLPQFEKLAKEQHFNCENLSLPQVMELINLVDDKLESQAEQLGSTTYLLKRLSNLEEDKQKSTRTTKMPPRAPGQQQMHQASSRQFAGGGGDAYNQLAKQPTNKFSSTQKYRSPVAAEGSRNPSQLYSQNL